MESVKGQLSLLNIPSFTAKAILKLLELYDFIVLGKKGRLVWWKNLSLSEQRLLKALLVYNEVC